MNTEEEVLFFFRNRLSEKITIDTVLNYLFPWEDEVIEVLYSFFIENNIKTEGFNILNFFFQDPESIPFLKLWYGILTSKYNPKTKPPLTIAHMIEVAKRKEWFEPE